MISCSEKVVEPDDEMIPDDYNVVVQLFDHPYEAAVAIQHDFDGDGNYVTDQMEAFSDHSYGLKISVENGQQYFKLLPTISHNNQDIIDEIPALSGIRAKSVTINEQEITTDFIVDGNAFGYDAAFSLNVNNDLITVGEGDVLTIPKMPAESSNLEQYVQFSNPREIPASGFSEAIIWLDMLHQRENTSPSTVKVDYIRLYSVSNGEETLITSNDFDDNVYAGAYKNRYPYYADDIFLLPSDPISGTVDNGVLTLQINDKQNHVWHLWNSTRGQVPADSEYLNAKTRIKIEGPAYFLMGIDFWKPGSGAGGTNVNNVEAGATDWQFNDTDWTELTFSLQK